MHVPRAGARATRPSVLGHRLAPVLCPASVAASCAGIRVCIQSGIRGCLIRCCFVCCACWQAAGSHGVHVCDMWHPGRPSRGGGGGDHEHRHVRGNRSLMFSSDVIYSVRFTCFPSHLPCFPAHLIQRKSISCARHSLNIQNIALSPLSNLPVFFLT